MESNSTRRFSPFHDKRFDNVACARGFKWLEAGFVLIALSLTPTGFRLVLELAGWPVMTIGVALITPSYRKTRRLSAFTAMMVTFSLVLWVMTAYRGVVASEFVTEVALFVMAGAKVCFIWGTCGLVADVARIMGDVRLRESARFRRILFAGGMLLLGAASIPTPRHILFRLPGIALVIFSSALISDLLRRASRVAQSFVTPHEMEMLIAEHEERNASEGEPPERAPQ